MENKIYELDKRDFFKEVPPFDTPVLVYSDHFKTWISATLTSITSQGSFFTTISGSTVFKDPVILKNIKYWRPMPPRPHK